MEAQSIRITLHDESAGYAVSPGRVPLHVLRGFIKDVDEFLRGGEGEGLARDVEVAVLEGSLALESVPDASPGLVRDLEALAASDRIDGLSSRRRQVVERWQRAARASKGIRYVVTSAHMERSVVIDAASDFHADDADQWVRVERYVQGEVFEMGGLTKVNAHIRLPDDTDLVVNTRREVLSSDPQNRLFKQALVRIVAEFNIATREHRNAELIEFVAQDTKIDERAMERMVQRGIKAWADVPDASAWVESIRGNDA